MGQGADQVRRGEAYRLREGESVVIAPEVPSVAHQHAGAGDSRGFGQVDTRATGQAVPAGLGATHAHEGTTEDRPPDSPEAIEANIEQTRMELSSTIDALQQRLNPEALKEEAKDKAGDMAEHAKEAAREAVQHAVHEAKLHVHDAIEDARFALRDATIGKVENMARMVSETTEDTRYGIVETIKQNPIPAALAGIGLAWLMMNRQSAPARPQRRSYLDDRGYALDRGYAPDRYYREGRERYGYGYEAYSSTPGYAPRREEPTGVMDRAQGIVGQAGDKVGQVADQAGDKVGQVADRAGEMVGRAGDTIGQVAGQAGETASNLVSQAQQQTQRVEDRVGRALQDTPLAVGAVALALGAAVGLAVPTTSKENELFGSARDNLVQQAQDYAQEAIGKVQAVAGEAGQTVQREAQAQGLVG